MSTETGLIQIQIQIQNAAFSKRARREVVEPVFADDWEPRPSGRSRDDRPGF